MIVHCLHDALVSVKELKPNPLNRNSHPKDQIERLAKILEFQGWRYPIKVSKRSGLITSGHGRLEAAKLLKWKEVPVSFQDYESEEQEYADTISDNSIASWSELDLSGINSDLTDLGPDFDIDLLGIKDFVLEPIEKLEPQCDEDEIPDALPEPKVVKGEVYILGNHRLMCGDSSSITDIEKLCGRISPEAIVTDPPYGIGIDGQKKSVSSNPKHNRKEHEFRGWDSERPDSGIFNYIVSLKIPSVIWGGNYFADLLPPTRGWIYWNKGQDGLTMSDGELAWTTEETPLRAVKVNRGALKGSVHPTQKPLEVIEFSLKYINAKSTVMDLFGGSGSTLIACEKTDRHCFMMELDPHYCGVILDRWQKFTGKKAHREDGVAWDEIKAGVADGAA
jgi:hypothetical protein